MLCLQTIQQSSDKILVGSVEQTKKCSQSIIAIILFKLLDKKGLDVSCKLHLIYLDIMYNREEAPTIPKMSCPSLAGPTSSSCIQIFLLISP